MFMIDHYLNLLINQENSDIQELINLEKRRNSDLIFPISAVIIQNGITDWFEPIILVLACQMSAIV